MRCEVMCLKRTWYGFPDFRMLLALPSSLTFGSPGWKGSTLPVCECGLLKLDAWTKKLGDDGFNTTTQLAATNRRPRMINRIV